jgi:hypothetical protein
MQVANTNGGTNIIKRQCKRQKMSPATIVVTTKPSTALGSHAKFRPARRLQKRQAEPLSKMLLEPSTVTKPPPSKKHGIDDVCITDDAFLVETGV